jgi:hypothetical protein
VGGPDKYRLLSDDEIREVVGALEATTWQPIATAPLDGTEVLAWREDCGQFIALHTSADAFPLTQDEIDQMDEETLFAKSWFTQWPQAIRCDGSETPTHWMRLPERPNLNSTTPDVA